MFEMCMMTASTGTGTSYSLHQLKILEEDIESYTDQSYTRLRLDRHRTINLHASRLR